MKRLTFPQFARKLADVTLVAINSGTKISAKRSMIFGKVCCPLGAHPAFRKEGNGKPADWDAGPTWRISDDSAFAFACGFDGDGAIHHDITPSDRRYYALGQKYAARFP